MLLTRAPLSPKTSFDLHVLGMPPAFVLSQDQTLRLNSKPAIRVMTKAKKQNANRDQRSPSRTSQPLPIKAMAIA